MVSFDFQKNKNSAGQVRYTYLEAQKDNWNGVESILPCDLVILDENYKEINRVNYVMQDGSKAKLENHTYIYLDDNHYILTTYQNIEVDKIDEEGGKAYISDCLIQEVKDNNVLWEFKSSDYPEFLKYSKAELLDYSKPYQDYIHINSIAIDKDDGNLLCSFRNIDTILKIERNTGKVLWKLGGLGDEFLLDDLQKFSKQHSVISVGNNTILLYDNGNANRRSRILKIKLNEEDKKIEEFEEYDLELYAYMMGSVRVIDDQSETFLICYGGGKYTKSAIEEISYETNETKFKFTFHDNQYKWMYNINKIP